MEDLLGFRKQGGQRANIQIFVLLKAEVIVADSRFAQPADIGLYE
jgi:hypothetical protein